MENQSGCKKTAISRDYMMILNEVMGFQSPIRYESLKKIRQGGSMSGSNILKFISS